MDKCVAVPYGPIHKGVQKGVGAIFVNPVFFTSVVGVKSKNMLKKSY